MSDEKTVSLIENFTSYQGEGPDSGRGMVILRFKTCNLKCPWCDTYVKMRISAESPHKLSDIQKTIDETRSGIMITGGEPTVPKHFDETLMLLNNLRYTIANVETNGFNLEGLLKNATRTANIHFVYSPKIFDANDLKRAIDKSKDVLKYDNVYIKIVFEDNTLINTYCEWLSSYIDRRRSYYNKIWLMPEGATREDLIKNSSMVFDSCEKYGFNFSSRDHIIFNFI